MAEIGLPVLVGFLIEVSSDLLKLVTHYISSGVEGADFRDPEFWPGCSSQSDSSQHHCGSWRAGRKRTQSVLYASSPPSSIRSAGRYPCRLRQAPDRRVHGLGSGSFSTRHRHLVEANNDLQRHSELDCIGECWLRLRYNEPMSFGEHWVTPEFGRDEKLIRKCDMHGDCSPPRPTEPPRNPH